MQLGSIDSLLSQAQAAASGFVNKTENYISTQLSLFRDKRGQLRYSISKLKAHAPKTTAPQALKDDYARTLAAATDASEKAEWIGKIADQFTAITGLGVLPAIVAGLPIAVLIAAVVIAGGVIYTAVKEISLYVGRAQTVEAAQAAGRDPLTALQQYNATAASGGIFGDASKLIWPIAIVGGLYLIYENSRKRR